MAGNVTFQAERRLRAALAQHRGLDGSQVRRWRTALTLALYGGDLDRAERALRAASTELTPAVALDEVLAPALHDIGLLWERDEITTADEHLATNVAQCLAAAVATMFERSPAHGRETVLLATPPSERHTTALIVAEAMVRGLGYRTVLLGAGVPLPAFGDAIARHAPEYVAISATMAFPEELVSVIASVREHAPRATILTGGASVGLASADVDARALDGMHELLSVLDAPSAHVPPKIPLLPRQPVEDLPRGKLHHNARLASSLPPAPDRGGDLDRVVDMLSGASDLERSQRALLEAAEEVSGSGSWAWDVAADRLVWSENVFRILGLQRDEQARGVGAMLEYVHPGDQTRIEEIIQRARQGEETTEFSYRIVTARGMTRFVQAVLAAKLPRDSGPVLVGWLRDLTESRRAEREIAAHIAVAEALSTWDDSACDVARLLAELSRALGFFRAVLWVPEDGALIPKVTWDESDSEALMKQMCRARIRPGQALAGRAWQDRDLVLVRGIGEATGYEFHEEVVRDHIEAAMAMPLVRGDEVLAVIGFAGPDLLALTGRMRASLTGIAHELGAFLASRRAELRASVLSPREIEVLQLASQGLSGPEIAKRLYLSPATVKTHFENVYAKYEVRDRVSAVAKALREGLIR